MATRRRTLLVLAVAAMMVVPVAISWACGPNRAIQLDRFSYPPGGQVTVTGANFYPNLPITISLDGAPVANPTSSGGGNFSVTINAPTALGTHTVTADGIDPNTGQSLGTGTPQAFTVVAPVSTTPAPTGGGNAPGRSPVPGTTPGTQPGTNRQSGRNRTSGRERSRVPARERSGAGRQPSSPGTGTGTGALNTNEGVIQAAGRTAFAGSVTRKDRAAAATGKSKAGAGATSRARPATGSAIGDLWRGFASSKNPSLVAGGSTAPAAGTSTGVVAGLGLLGLGLLALVGLGGIIAAGRRKGRSRAS